MSLSDKKICVGEVKLGTLNSDLPYFVFPKEDVKEAVRLLDIDTFKSLEDNINVWQKKGWEQALDYIRERIKFRFGKELCEVEE